MTPNRIKISLIGSGQIGSTLANLCLLKGLGDVVLFDVVTGMPEGKSLDLSHATPIDGIDCRFKGTNSYADIANSDVIIVTAGVPRKPGMSRDDLISINSGIIKDVALNIKQYSPNAFVICITNPLDVMVCLLQKVSLIPENMVCGMAGELDVARFKFFLAEKLNVSVRDISALVMGGHGDTMVLLARYCSVSGIPLPELIETGWITKVEVDDIIARTRDGGGEIVKLLKQGSAFYGPAAAAISMVESYIMDKKRLVSCAAYLRGQYGVTDLYVGVPCIIGRGGVEKIVELSLKPEELQSFLKSVNAVRSLCNQLPEFKHASVC